jgi:hypothetical protein
MTPREQLVVRYGVATMLVAVVVLRLGPSAVRRMGHAERTLAQQASLLARARADVAGSQALVDTAALVSRQLAALPRALLTGATPRAAAGDLARRVRAAVPGSRAQVQRLERLSDATMAGLLRRATVRATLHTDVQGLGRVLRALHTGDVVLVVRELDVAPQDPNGTDHRAEVLRVRLVVSGWYAREIPQHGAHGG